MQEWIDTGPTTIEPSTMISLLNIRIGIHSNITEEEINNRFTRLQNRIVSLISDQKIDEDLLVMGLVQAVENIINESIIEHGTNLIEYMSMDDESSSIRKDILNKLSAPTYLLDALRDLDNWRKIVTSYFGTAKRRYWSINRKLERYNDKKLGLGLND